MNTRKTQRVGLVTGATGGIGLALADKLAAEGFGLVLAARGREELERLGECLTRERGVQTWVVAADLSEAGGADDLAAEVERLGLEVEILVNNAVFAQYGDFLENDAGMEERMIQLNTVALTRLTRLLLPGMARRRAGRIVNVESTAAFMPGPHPEGPPAVRGRGDRAAVPGPRGGVARRRRRRMPRGRRGGDPLPR